MRSRPVPRGVRLYDPATLARLCRARDYLADKDNSGNWFSLTEPKGY